MKLVIGNRNYSSWSLRPWLLIEHAGLPLEEVEIPLFTPEGDALLKQWSPSGKVPVLHDGPLVLWDSLAICEYIADKSTIPLWPEDTAERATARAISAEMHAGFHALRETMPMNIRRRMTGFRPDLDTRIDIDRVVQIIENALAESERRGADAVSAPWLFGDYSVADAMYAPVMLRFRSYGIALPTRARRYQARVLDDVPMRRWCALAEAETTVIAAAEVADADVPDADVRDTDVPDTRLLDTDVSAT
ncbi:MAG: glutathione S-transferase [Gammaproteobacteria bacterium]|nr:MAG: glutathione S-transferase [Gammaproteobacteria bacterium]PIE37503.1 MAG: glutathione S-transferase [Gammaproteobacteria bacterium]